MGAHGQGRKHKWSPVPAARCPWRDPLRPAPSSAPPPGKPWPPGTQAPWPGSPGRGGGRWAAARIGCGSRRPGPGGAAHSSAARAASGSGAGAAAPCCQRPRTFEPAGRLCWRSGCPGPPCRPWLSTDSAPLAQTRKDGEQRRWGSGKARGQLTALRSETQ